MIIERHYDCTWDYLWRRLEMFQCLKRKTYDKGNRFKIPSLAGAGYPQGRNIVVINRYRPLIKFRCLRKIIDFKPPQPHRVIDVQICEHEVSFVNSLGRQNRGLD
jgi:hypothetical protein